LRRLRRLYAEHTDEMRSYGMYVYCSRGTEVLLDPLRGCEGHDDSDVSLRASWVRREGVGWGGGDPIHRGEIAMNGAHAVKPMSQVLDMGHPDWGMGIREGT